MDNILEKINRAGLKFLSPLTLQQTYSVVVEEAVKLIGAHSAALYLMQDGKLIRVAFYPHDLDRIIKPRKKGFTYQAYVNKKTMVVSGAQFDDAHPGLKKRHFKSAIYIPISYHHQSIGTLSLLLRNEKRFSEKEIKSFDLFGSYVSLAIHKSQLFEEIKEALSTRDLFISMAAHELRTPLTTISGYTQLLHSKFSGSDSAEARWVEGLLWESSRLTQLVNELLEVNRIKNGQFQYVWQECSLKQIIERTVLNFRFNHPYYKITIHDHLSNGQDRVIGDCDKLIQVLTNLLDNAAKFSSSATEIIVNLRFKLPYIVLQVKDQGKGIDKADMPRIFEGFYKGRDPSKEGMGLGLFLAKNIIEEHRGSIHLHSKLNKGTTAEIHLPKAKI